MPGNGGDEFGGSEELKVFPHSLFHPEIKKDLLVTIREIGAQPQTGGYCRKNCSVS
jgi:hypothetical protein